MSVFYLVRHAHADWSPDENRPLSSRGLSDAEQVAQILGNLPINAVFSSPYRRARQTIKPLADRLKLDIHINQDLRERKLAAGQVKDFLQAVERTWLDPMYAHQEGESNSSAQRRGMAVLHRLNEQFTDSHLVLSTHGNLLAVTLQGFDPSIDFAFWKSLTFPDIYQLDFASDCEAIINRIWSGHDSP